MISWLSFLLVFPALPATDGQSTSSRRTYIAPMLGPGSVDNATIKIKTPDGSGRFPVFMWLMGTYDKFDDTEPYMGNLYNEFTEYMASKGYIAAIPDYANADFCLTPCEDALCSFALSSLIGKPTGAVGKIGQPEKVRGLKRALDVLCALPKADCALGVAVAGHSQGAYSTVQLATIDARVTAISPWSYGYLNISDKETSLCVTNSIVGEYIPREKRRMVVGSMDDLNSLDAHYDMKGPQVFSGYNYSSSIPPIDCIQPDGSGYWVIGKSEYSDADRKVTPPDNIAGHPFFNTKDPVGYFSRMVPTFESGSKPWNMRPMFDWLAGAAKDSSQRSLLI